MLNTIKAAIIGFVRSAMRWGGRTLISLILFFAIRRIFPWPFRQFGLRMTRKYGPGVLNAVRPYAERGVETVSGVIQQVRGHEMQPAGIDTMPDIQRPTY